MPKRNEAHLPDDKNPSVSLVTLPPSLFLFYFSVDAFDSSMNDRFGVFIWQIVWDEKKQRWVDLNEPEEEVRNFIFRKTETVQIMCSDVLILTRLE